MPDTSRSRGTPWPGPIKVVEPLVRGVNRGYASQAEASDAKVEGAKRRPEFLGPGRELAGGQLSAEPADHRRSDLGQLGGRAVPGSRDEDDLGAGPAGEEEGVGLTNMHVVGAGGLACLPGQARARGGRWCVGLSAGGAGCGSQGE